MKLLTSLVIYYSLGAFNRELQSEPEMVPALYHREDGTLYFMRTDGRLGARLRARWQSRSSRIKTLDALLPDSRRCSRRIR